MAFLLSRRALLFGMSALAAAPVARAQPGMPRVRRRGFARRLDLGLGPLELEPAPAAPSPPEPAAPPAEPGPRAGLSLELRRAGRRDRAPADPTVPEPDRDALAERLERLGIEELVIRLRQPL